MRVLILGHKEAHTSKPLYQQQQVLHQPMQEREDEHRAYYLCVVRHRDEARSMIHEVFLVVAQNSAMKIPDQYHSVVPLRVAQVGKQNRLHQNFQRYCQRHAACTRQK
jgi:hypothetical protein